jgi:outer membrane autotransporter protein
VLNVSGDYVGNGGTLRMSAVLGDDNSVVDRMNVSGNTSGSSQIVITNRQGLGGKTSNGIEIISVGGSSDGTFTLNGDYKTKDGKQAIMTGSAYAYTLQKGGANTPNDGNWYLVSQNEKSGPGPDPDCTGTNSCPTPPPGPNPDRYSAAAPVYESYAATLQALNKLPTLQQRAGERYLGRNNQTEPGEMDNKAIWGRIEGAHNRQENSSTAGDLHQDINTFIMQAGVDGQFYEDENGKLIAGITGQYGNARSDIDNRTGDGSGTINTQGWGLGATATWYGASGFYLDAQAQANWYDSDLGVDAINPTLKNGNKGFGYAMSVEAGQRFAIDQNWSLTPQAQLMWSSVDFDSFSDTYGARISNRNGDSLNARLGLAANYANSFTGSDGRMVNTSVYGIANLYQELMGDARMNYAGTHMATDSDGTWGGIGAGGTYSWADYKYAIYGEGSINTSLNHFADSYNIKGNIGFRVRW